MNKFLVSGIVSLVAVIAVPLSASATPVVSPLGPTQIDGEVTQSNGVTPVVGASVYAVCDGHTSASVQSVAGGLYQITFPVAQCATGDQVSVYATKGKMAGSDSNPVYPGKKYDFSVVDVSVALPEMGVATATVAAAAAGGTILVTRRRRLEDN
jgi:hypothetical protein